MKTTLNLDDDLVREAKKRAADRGTTLTQVIEEALRDALAESEPHGSYEFNLPTVAGGGPARVDVADRAALYDLMEGRDVRRRDVEGRD